MQISEKEETILEKKKQELKEFLYDILNIKGKLNTSLAERDRGLDGRSLRDGFLHKESYIIQKNIEILQNDVSDLINKSEKDNDSAKVKDIKKNANDKITELFSDGIK